MVNSKCFCVVVLLLSLFEIGCGKNQGLVLQSIDELILAIEDDFQICEVESGSASGEAGRSYPLIINAGSNVKEKDQNAAAVEILKKLDNYDVDRRNRAVFALRLLKNGALTARTKSVVNSILGAEQWNGFENGVVRGSFGEFTPTRN
jgi:hypothetical protein